MDDPVLNIPGNDFTVHEGDKTPEGFTCLVAQNIDGPWISLGAGTGTTSFDLGSAGVTSARFIKIVDDGDGQQNEANAGFDLDAIEAIVPPSGIRIADGANDYLRIVPNPATDFITVRLRNSSESGSVTVYNAQGREIIPDQMINGFLRIDIQILPAGLYFVKFIHSDRTQTVRFVRQ
jgi:hypothetical protein